MEVGQTVNHHQPVQVVVVVVQPVLMVTVLLVIAQAEVREEALVPFRQVEQPDHIPEIVPEMIPGAQVLQEVLDQVEMEAIVPILPAPVVPVVVEVDFLVAVPEAMAPIQHLVVVAVVDLQTLTGFRTLQ